MDTNDNETLTVEEIEGKQIIEKFFEKNQWYRFNNFAEKRYIIFKGLFTTTNKHRCLINSIGFSVKGGNGVLSEVMTTASIPMPYENVKRYIVDEKRFTKITKEEANLCFDLAVDNTKAMYYNF